MQTLRVNEYDMAIANKRIRRFMPGDTDLATVPQRDLIYLARHLNDQPLPWK